MPVRRIILAAVFGVTASYAKEQIERDIAVPVEVQMKTETQTIEAAPEYVCDDGATLNPDGTCTSLVESKAKKHCPKGTRSNGTGCVSRSSVAPISSCPEGTMHGKKCVVYETAPSTLECPRGYTFSAEGICAADADEHHAKKICGKGARLENGVCVMTESVKPQYVCADGTLSGSNCESTMTMAPVCKDGFLGDGNTCVSTKKSKPSHNCPHGYNSDRNGGCSKKIVVEPEIECESGDLDERGNCVAVETAAIEYTCNKGFELQGLKCVKMLEEEPKASCPRGWKEKDGACLMHHSKRSNSVCPPEFELKGKKCVGEEIITATQACREDEYLSNGECVRSEASDKALTCPEKGYKLKDGVCVLHKQHRAETQCPAGSVEDGHKCIITTTVAAEEECARGESRLPNGMCGTLKTRAPDAVCPKGYKSTAGKKNDAVDAAAQCVKETYVSPTMACPPGHNLEGRNCVAESTAAMISECEGGLSKNGACLDVKTSKAKAVCPEGFSMKRGTCYRKVKVEVPVVSSVSSKKHDKTATSSKMHAGKY